MFSSLDFFKISCLGGFLSLENLKCELLSYWIQSFGLPHFGEGGEWRLSTDAEKITFHPNRLRIMFAGNIVFAGAMGLMFLFAPDSIYSLFGATAVDSMWAAGYAYSFMVALGIFAVLGLRSPIKFSAVLLVQAATKLIWILAIAIPALVVGTLPTYGLVLAVVFAVWAICDMLVVPLRHMFVK